MKKFPFTILLFLFCGNLYAKEGFEGIQCGSDIPKALIGKQLSNEQVVVSGYQWDL